MKCIVLSAIFGAIRPGASLQLWYSFQLLVDREHQPVPRPHTVVISELSDYRILQTLWDHLNYLMSIWSFFRAFEAFRSFDVSIRLRHLSFLILQSYLT